MDRRTLLRRCGVALPAAGLAGCLGGGGGGSPAEDLSVDSFDYEEGENGTLVVVVTVVNSAAETRTGTLYVNVEANGTANTRVRTVEVGPAKTTEVRASFDVTVAEFEQSGSIDADWKSA